VDPAAAPFLEPFGHRAAGPSRREPVEVGNAGEQPWSLYLEVSRAVGLDFSTLQGRTGELVRTPVAGDAADAELIVLVVGGRAVGAWISPGGGSSGVLPVSARH
jgi:hypothetical protein